MQHYCSMANAAELAHLLLPAPLIGCRACRQFRSGQPLDTSYLVVQNAGQCRRGGVPVIPSPFGAWPFSADGVIAELRHRHRRSAGGYRELTDVC